MGYDEFAARGGLTTKFSGSEKLDFLPTWRQHDLGPGDRARV